VASRPCRYCVMSNSTTLNYQVNSSAQTGTVLLPQATGITSGQPITFAIPLLYTGGNNYQSYQYSNASFQFQLSQGNYGPTGTPLIFANITIGGNAWGTNRTALMADFTDFLQNIETQFELTGILAAGATFRIGQQIADCIPAPLAETLFYRYSLSAGFAPGTLPYIDIRPGMRLRVETQASQYLTPTSPLNGYVGSGHFSYLIGSAPAGNGTRVVTFDPFLSTIKSPMVNPPPSPPSVAGGVIDLQGNYAAQKYWRLFYPQQVTTASQAGNLYLSGNVALVGAQSLAQLNTATKSFPQQPSPQTNPPSVYTIFLGRAVAVPEIPIWLNIQTIQNTNGTPSNPLSGTPVQTVLQYVPVGTTLANLIERFTALPLDLRLLPASASSTPALPVLSVARVLNAPFIPPPAQGANSAYSAPVIGNIYWQTQGLPSVPTVMFDVPLIAGDIVTIAI
jgi:hypothetical protein